MSSNLTVENTNSITRQITIHQEEITYKLRYSRRAKYLRLQITRGHELELIVPRGYELKEAESFIIKKADWVKKHLKKNKEHEKEFMLFGNEIKINQSFQLFIKKHKIKYSANELKVTSPAGNREKLHTIFDAWLKHVSKNYLRERAFTLAEAYGFNINKVTIRSQKTRWGSASIRGNLSFNFRLMRYRKEVIDYVIVHELCHLKEMNHSKKFWALVEKYCPDHKTLRKELKGKG